MQVPFSVDTLFNLLTFGLITGFIILVTSHFISRLFLAKTPVKLRNNSFVVITGGCMGIGKQMATQIVKQYHCTILIADIRKDLFDSVHENLSKYGSIIECYYCDLSSRSSVKDFVTFLKERNQKIDMFIHNAGIIVPKTALQTSQKEFMLQLTVNYIQPVNIIRSTIQLMKGGHICVVSSMVPVIHGGTNMSAYSASKAAMLTFVNCFRQELKSQTKKNVTISVACPYAITTGMFKGFSTRLNFLIRPLSPDYVAKRLVKQFIEKREICYVPQYLALVFRLLNLFPTYFLDKLEKNINNSDFSTIRSKHDQKIKEMKEMK